MFKIIDVQRVSSDSVKVSIEMDSKEWNKTCKAGDLGSLYGVDISNKVYREYGVKAYNPTVSVRRARFGIKLIELYYADSVWTPAPNNVIQVDFVNRRRVA